MYNPYDHYFKKAKKEGYKARSVFKLEEIDQKYKIFDCNTHTVLDIGYAPWWWIQYTYKKLTEKWCEDFKIIGLDIKESSLSMPGVFCFMQDVTDLDKVNQIFKSLDIDKFDTIISDMAPNTIWVKDIDAIKSIALLENTLYLYKNYFKPEWKFVIKIFMGPGFDEFVKTLKDMFGGKNIKLYKPDASRKQSKEIYIVKYK